MTRKLLPAALAGVLTASVLALAPTASAEPTFTPGPTDIVGVGSDTSMLVMQDLADAYNVGRTTGRLVSFDAGAPPALSAQIVLRQGKDPVNRPNGSGAGKQRLYGANNNPDVNFARSSSSLNDAERQAGLFQVPFAIDELKVAVRAAGTNAPAALTAADLVAIYSGQKTNWSEFGRPAGQIIPIIPQPGSGTRSFFEGELRAANGGNPVTLGGNVVEEQEHDPSPVAASPNAIAPFSTSRLDSTVTTLEGAGSFIAQRAIYNVVREADLDEPWFDAIFGEDGFLCSQDGQAVTEAAGFKHLATPANDGVCGEATQQTTSNLTTSDPIAAETGTTLTATSPAANRVVLRATVSAGSTAAPGTVEFVEGEVSRGTVALTQGVAQLTLTGVPAGRRTYRAIYTPAEGAAFEGSESVAVTVTVKAPAAPAAATAVAVKTGKVVAGKKAKATVTVTARGTSAKPAGTVQVFQGKKRVAQGAVKNGKAVVTLPKLKAGKVKLRFAYVGNARFKASAKTVTIRVVRAR